MLNRAELVVAAFVDIRLNAVDEYRDIRRQSFSVEDAKLCVCISTAVGIRAVRQRLTVDNNEIIRDVGRGIDAVGVVRPAERDIVVRVYLSADLSVAAGDLNFISSEFSGNSQVASADRYGSIVAGAADFSVDVDRAAGYGEITVTEDSAAGGRLDIQRAAGDIDIAVAIKRPEPVAVDADIAA